MSETRERKKPGVASVQALARLLSTMQVDDMVVMMNLLDTDGDGTVTKTEFGVYYKRLKDCDNAAFEAVWKEIDTNGDGNLTLNELCDYYGVDQGEAASALKKFKKEMTDEKVLEALQLQSLLNEEQQRQDKQKKAHADRLAALAALCDEEDEEDEEAMASPPPKAKGPVAESPLTLDQLTREAKRRGDLAPHHFNS